MRGFWSLIAFAIWIAGIVIAKGFWWTVASIFIPPVAWYLIIERVLTHFGFIGG